MGGRHVCIPVVVGIHRVHCAGGQFAGLVLRFLWEKRKQVYKARWLEMENVAGSKVKFRTTEHAVQMRRIAVTRRIIDVKLYVENSFNSNLSCVCAFHCESPQLYTVKGRKRISSSLKRKVW